MSEGDTLVVHVQNTVEDFSKFCQNVQSVKLQRAYFFTFLIPLLVVGFIFFRAVPDWISYRFELSNEQAQVASLVGLFTGLFGLLISLNFLKNRAHTGSLDPNGAFLQRFSLTLSDEGVRMESRGTRIEIVWSAILRAQETSTSFFLYVDRAMAYIVRKRDFVSQAQEEKFAEIVRAHLVLEAPVRN